VTIHCRWEDEVERERTDHPPSYAEVKKTKSLKLYESLRASVKDCSPSSYRPYKNYPR